MVRAPVACLSAGVGDLNADGRAGSHGLQGADEGGDSLDVFVLPDADIFWRDTSTGFNGRCFDRDRTRTVDRKATQVSNVVGRHETVVGGVHAWRRKQISEPFELEAPTNDAHTLG